MELKDVILSTLAEMEDDNVSPSVDNTAEKIKENNFSTTIEEEPMIKSELTSESGIDSELAYLSSIRERLLVLFEGFQAPNNSNIEAKVDMTLNFLEYTLATIDLRVEKLEKGTLK